MKEIKIKCDNCNGTGYIPHYNHVENGICFKCMGSGFVIEKQYSKEELKKKEQKANKKRFASLKELRGFKNTDILYLIEDENTYNKKDEIKKDGAIWNWFFRKWVFENDDLKNKYKLVKITFEETLKEGDL